MSDAPEPSSTAYMAAELPASSTPWREATYSVVDLELTGLDPSQDEIVSFATVTVTEGRIRLQDSLHRIVQPRRMPNADTIRIHGLREQDLAAAPRIDQALGELIGALTGRVLVAHAAAVEADFLRPALASHGLELRNPVIDTAGLALELWRLRGEPPLRAGGDQSPAAAISSPGLAELARGLGLPVHRPHHADGDALTTAQVFLALATHLEAFGKVTVGSLEKLSTPEREEPAPGRAIARLFGRLTGR